MTRFLQKSMLFGLVMAVSVLLFGAANAQAASSGNHTPRIEKITQVTKTSIVVPFKIKRFANEKVSVFVHIKQHGNTMEKMYTAKLNDMGNGNVTVKGLMPDTKYVFKVRVNDSKSSDSRSGRTSG